MNIQNCPLCGRICRLRDIDPSETSGLAKTLVVECVSCTYRSAATRYEEEAIELHNNLMEKIK